MHAHLPTQTFSQSGDIERYRTDDDDNFTQVLELSFTVKSPLLHMSASHFVLV